MTDHPWREERSLLAPWIPIAGAMIVDGWREAFPSLARRISIAGAMIVDG
ncbi:MAG TPA: hypothetical protein VK762_15430 [Polyangiaceae bacterium]|nr:hypothetical protein [Polyangiaceae bacterium]